MCGLQHKRFFGKLFAWSLAASLFLGAFAGCGKQDKQQGGDKQNGNSSDTTNELVWVPEYVSLEPGRNYSMPKVYDDFLWFVDYSWDEATGVSTQALTSLSLKDGSPGETIVLSSAGADEDTSSSRYVNSFFKSKDGKFCTLEMVYHWDEERGDGSMERFLCKRDETGEVLSEGNLEEKMSSDGAEYYIQGVAVDSEDRLYLAIDGGQIQLFDAEGNYSGTIDAGGADAWINGIGTGKDGRVYIVQYDRTADGGGMVLKELDFEKKAVGTVYGNYPNSYGNDGLSPGRKHDFLVNDGKSLCGYDLATQSSEKLFDWLDSDINGEYVNYMYELEDGRIMAFIQDWSAGTCDLVFLSQKNAAEVTQKTTLTLGTFYMSQEIQAAAVNFNRSSDKWRIKVKTYFDDSNLNGNIEAFVQDATARMNGDLVSDNCPDLLVLDWVNVENYAQKGLFEDLGGYLDKSGRLSREDFFENILQAYTYSDTLVAIPKNFTLSTVAGKAAELGTESGWTMEDLMAYADAHPGTEVFDHANRAYILETMLRYNQSSYIDWTTGKCFFDDDSFVKLLEFTNRFPEETNWSADETATPLRIQAGEILLYETNLYSFDSIQMPTAIFDEAVNYIGYPNSKGESGVYIDADSNCIAITAKSAHKDGAWEFLEDYLCTESERYSWGFASNKKQFEEAKQQAIAVEYLKDENGELILDEDGNPIQIGGSSSWGWGDWFYEFHRPTEEEVDALMKLLEAARPASDCDQEVLKIVREEADAYFKGQKSAKDVAGVIQSRVQIYVNENR